MASTVITQIDFNSSAFKDIMLGVFTDKLGLLSSGILQTVPDAVISSQDKGYTVSIPHYNTISGDSDQITTGLTTTVNALATYKDIGVWAEREKAWGADQMIRVIAGADPMAEVARQVGEYLAVEAHKQAMSTITGVFATELATTHSTGGDFAGAEIEPGGVLAAKQKLGDNQDQLTEAVMNSKVYQDALKNGLIVNQVNNVSNDFYRTGMIGKMLGMNTTMSDKLTATSSVYPTYFAAPGAVIYKYRERPVSVETNANITRISVGGIIADLEKHRVALTAGGQDVLILRYSLLTHVPGVQFDGTVATNPTNTQLATATSWTKVATDDKLIKIVELKTL